jgi:hypothetical protein
VPKIAVAAAVLIAAAVLFFWSRSVTVVAAALGSGVIVLAVLAHLGVLAAVIGTLVARYRRQQH